MSNWGWNGAPIYYDHANMDVNRATPSTIHVKNTTLASFYRRYLLQKCMSVFEWKMPEWWAEDYFKYVLYCWGYVAVFNTDKFGVICQQCGLRGYDVFYRPTHAIITNPLIYRTIEPRIGTQCTLIRLQPDYGGVLDLVSFYADQMAIVMEAMAANAFNSKIGYVFAASDSTIAQSIKKMFDQLSSGEPLSVVNKKLFNETTGEMQFDVLGTDIAKSPIVNEMLTAARRIEMAFDRDIGLPSLASEKKEREISAELEQNTIAAESRVAMWLQHLQATCEETRKMFGIEVSVDWRRNEVMTYESKTESTRNAGVAS